MRTSDLRSRVRFSAAGQRSGQFNEGHSLAAGACFANAQREEICCFNKMSSHVEAWKPSVSRAH